MQFCILTGDYGYVGVYPSLIFCFEVCSLLSLLSASCNFIKSASKRKHCTRATDSGCLHRGLTRSVPRGCHKTLVLFTYVSLKSFFQQLSKHRKALCRHFSVNSLDF